ncbi:hypothetical protein [Pedobacter alluvionis]|uniref:Uncharacterized protein n=1 Tax=Pedobacter alluvionis TaxID=475253 RepID=A0A497Y393_9SPHI|nr:hypothetical protein [Pedobacter alluvionis]RLJ77341.1 hypothetical protein BCL90_2426 [Pedobacter alluvionis]TFB33437.1 hypothetical protein E3V97_05160 [Pedobacter alluvionis]
MTNLSIGFDFVFNVAVKKANGKTFKSHAVNGLGTSYDNAIWDIYFKLKRKRIEILAVNTVRVARIAYAIEDGKSISLQLADCTPYIPEDLNSSLKYLPKKAVS